jgi:hypothetical protein
MKVLELTSENPDPNEVRSGALQSSTSLLRTPDQSGSASPLSSPSFLQRMNNSV